MMPTTAELIGHLRDHPDDLTEPLEDHLREFDWSWEAVMRAVLSVPESDGVRLMAARWLEENAGGVPCGACKGNGRDDKFMRAKDWFRSKTGPSNVTTDCSTCPGTGRFPDVRRERAEFIRVQVELARKESNTRMDPTCWCDQISPGLPCCDVCQGHEEEVEKLRRREGELALRHLRQWFSFLSADGHVAAITDVRFVGIDATYFFRRGLVDEVACTAADWIAHHGALYWHPDQRVRCLGGCWPLSGVYVVTSNPSATKFSAGPSKRCSQCTGTGTVPRSFVPSAQPIRVVNLTTMPGDTPGWGNHTGVGYTKSGTADVTTYPAWPGVEFHFTRPGG